MKRGRGTGSGRSAAPGSVRIIGGEWRGRRLNVPAIDALRPTPDRVRETLFNWLAPILPGSRVLDLFAGTGVLGLEAVSRGAEKAWLVESAPVAAAGLERAVSLLQASAEVIRSDAWRFLRSAPPARFRVVFLDPPYESTDYGALCTLLGPGWLTDDAYIYLEMSRRQTLPALPSTWTLHRESAAGDVQFALARRTARTTGVA